MSANSKIEWTEATWNPVRGCSRISPGCVNCYAERMAARDLPGLKSPTTGEPFAIITPSGPRWTGKVELIPHMLDVPLKRRKPTTYFVNSMSDLFHEALPDEAIDRVFAVMALCRQHTFQVLTKRADRMLHVMTKVIRTQKFWPMPNVHLGVSVENQEYADKRIPDLLATPAAVRFVSYEPALGPVDFRSFIGHHVTHGACVKCGVYHPAAKLDGCVYQNLDEPLDQIIIGGESGPGARPFDIEWPRNVITQCKGTSTRVFVKQLGAKPVGSLQPGLYPPQPMRLRDKKGGDMSEWPADLRVRQMPEVRR